MRNGLAISGQRPLIRRLPLLENCPIQTETLPFAGGESLANSITPGRLSLQYMSHINVLILQCSAIVIELIESI